MRESIKNNVLKRRTIVLDVLVKNFNVMPVSTPDEDLKAILG